MKKNKFAAYPAERFYCTGRTCYTFYDAIRTTTLLCNSRRAKNIRIPQIFNENRYMLMFWRSSGKIVLSCKHEHNLYLLTLASFYTIKENSSTAISVIAAELS